MSAQVLNLLPQSGFSAKPGQAAAGADATPPTLLDLFASLLDGAPAADEAPNAEIAASGFAYLAVSPLPAGLPPFPSNPRSTELPEALAGLLHSLPIAGLTSSQPHGAPNPGTLTGAPHATPLPGTLIGGLHSGPAPSPLAPGLLSSPIPGPLPVTLSGGLHSGPAPSPLVPGMPSTPIPEPLTATGHSSPSPAPLGGVHSTPQTPVITGPGHSEPLPGATQPESLLTQLVDALTALQTSLDNGETPGPALIERLSGLIDSLTALLQPQKPAPASTPPAIGATPSGVAAPGLQIAGQMFAGAAGAPVNFWSALVTTAPQSPSSPIPAPLVEGGIRPTDEPEPLLMKLAEKLASLATEAGAESGDLADKLTRMAETLRGASVSPELVVSLGLAAEAESGEPELKPALDALLAIKTEAQPAPQQQPFAAPDLKLPGDTTKAAEKPERKATPIVLSPDTESEPITGLRVASPRPVDIQDIPRATVAPSPAAVLPAAVTSDAPAEPLLAVQTGQPASIAVQAGLAAEVKAVHAAYQAPQINLPQVAFEIVRHVQEGASRFQIRLDPPELGRIDVKLDMDNGGNVNARLTVERAETLDLLQRDQRALERALAQAGLDAGKTNLEFSLRQNPFGRQDGDGGRNGAPAPGGGLAGGSAGEADPVLQANLYRGGASPGGVNIFV